MAGTGTRGIEGKVVLLTGAAGGIGAAAAPLLAKAGARLALFDRDAAALAALEAALPASERHRAFAVDLVDDDARAQAVADAQAHFGRIDVLVNNAGLLVGGHFEAASAARLRALCAVNLYVPLALCGQLIPLMRAQGGGHILNVISSAGLLAVPGFAAYNATKAGLYTFTRTLRRELRGTGIRVGAFCPGSTASPMTRAMIDAGGSPGGEAAHGTELPARKLLRALQVPCELSVVSTRPLGQRAAMLLDRVFPHLLDRLWNARCDDTYYALVARAGRAGRPD
jgi:short-subunit dehydrogenase